MAASTAGKTDTRTVHLQPGMYVVRFNGAPALGESALVSLASGDEASQVDFFASEAIINNTLVSADDCIIVRCSGGSSKILLTSLSVSSSVLAGTRIDKIASSTERLGGTAQAAGLKSPLTPESITLSGHIQWVGDIALSPGAWLGDPGNQNRLEGFTVDWENRPGDVDIAYSAILSGLGRSPAVRTGEFCGSGQRAAAITGLTFSLVGKNAAAYELIVEVKFDGSPVQKLSSGVEGRGVMGREQLVAMQLTVIRTA